MIKLFEDFTNSNELLNITKDVFQDLIDSDICDVFKDVENFDKDKNIICAIFSMPDDVIETNSFDVYFSRKKEVFNIYSEINAGLKRIESQYGNIDVNFDYYTNSDDVGILSLYINDEESKQGDFWKISTDNVVRIDNSKLLKLLDMPKNVSISRSSGSNDIISFNFSDKEQLDNYKDHLIKTMINLKIDGKDFITESKWSYSSLSGDEMSKYKVYREYDQHRSTGYYDRHKDIVNYISFGMNPELEYAW